MKKIKTSYRPVIAIAILLTLCLFAMFIIQISSTEEATKTESALFSILQLVFSTYVAWAVTDHYTKKSFIDSQKKFAISSFRRIKEIQHCVGKLYSYLNRENPNGINQEVVSNGLDHVNNLICSSIADWSDVIEDELRLTQEYERLKEIKNDTTWSQGIEKKDSRVLDQLESLRGKIEQIESELPPELRAMYQGTIQHKLISGCKLYSEIYKKDGHISFNCLWDKDRFSDANIFSVGDTVKMGLCNIGGIDNSLVALDQELNPLGVLTNNYRDSESYEEFKQVIIWFFGEGIQENSTILLNAIGTIKSIEEKTDSGRIYFNTEFTRTSEEE